MNTRHYAAARRTRSIGEKLFEVNWGLVMLIALIASVGFAMLYSVAGGHFEPWASKQIVRFVIGLVLLVVIACVDIRLWMELAYPAYGLSLLLLIATTIAGKVGGLGAQRWIELGPLQLQPSELMKISLVLALARYLHKLSVEEVSHPLTLLIPLAMIGAPVVLVLAQPNLGTAIILALDGCSLLFLAGLSWWWIGPAVAGVVASVPIAWQFLHDYQKQRIMTFLNPSSDALGAGWNISQAEIALGSGGVAGKGFIQGTQSRLNFLPEKETDFIFTALGEEFGLVGALALLLLFAVVIGYGIRIAMSSRSQFGRLLAMGVTLNFFFYILINASMVMGLIPVVGIPMPLISYGGTAMMTVMVGFGLLMCVHVHRQIEIPRSAGTIL
ncbi:MAG: rod shape-determining protein RodA [Alphaproteobacteria bacterium]|nr:rod shape-determining protein RodA [Alphaproteobacteria bacterium]MBU6472271.1 rod shape-determining protein RodA [Alphaproteobacteria bacterium]MDE2012429.1 rod shape-determining protein RodA [Alphaproteobacteria bacterium]MDE2072067.1 rod shape-determining protein RodA [Alphaproteobacteria bacterium]MDE2352365.1 rod shape-determining protein RodA [Alphaproteobacteria bacterium]